QGPLGVAGGGGVGGGGGGACRVGGGGEDGPAGPLFERRERGVARVRLARLRLLPPLGVEAPDERGVGGEAAGRGHLLDGVRLPEAARGPERRDAALRRHARAGEGEDPGVVVERETSVFGPLHAHARAYPGPRSAAMGARERLV